MNSDKHYGEETLLAASLGELEADEQRSVAGHVERCRRCRSVMEGLRGEFDEIARAVERDTFPSPQRVWHARAKILGQVKEDPAPAARRGWVRTPAVRWTAAAVVAVCVLGGAYWSTRRGGALPEPAAVLAEARRAESSHDGRPWFQSLRVEVAQSEPRRETSSRLETWFDPATRRYSSRWIGQNETLRHAVWNRGSGAWAWTEAAGMVPVREASGRQSASLLDAGAQGLTCEELAEGFLKYLRERPWRPLLMSDDLVMLSDDAGSRLGLSRAVARGREVLRLTVRKRTPSGIADVTLDVAADTYEPQVVTVRFEAGGKAAWLRIARETVRVVSAAALDPRTFEPNVPQRAQLRVDTPGEPKAPGSVPSRAEVLAMETRIRYALHQAGACRREFVRIEAGAGSLTVAATTGSAEMKSRILAALWRVQPPAWVKPDIITVDEAVRRVRPGSGGPARVPEDPAGAGLPLVSEPRLAVQDELQAHFGGASTGTEIMSFTNRAVALAEEALVEAWAVRRLAERYGTEADLDSASAALVQRMVQDHVAVLREKNSQGRQSLAPVLDDIAARRGLNARTGDGQREYGAGWAGNCLHLFQLVERMHTSVMALFAVDTGRAPAVRSGQRRAEAENANREVLALLGAFQKVDDALDMTGRKTAALSPGGVSAP